MKEAERIWTEAYQHFELNCGHMRSCNRAECVFKKRTIPYFILVGTGEDAIHFSKAGFIKRLPIDRTVLPFWSILKSLSDAGEKLNMKVILVEVNGEIRCF